MVYKVDPNPSVASQVARFPARTLHYWNVSLSEIAVNPFPRYASYVEPLIPIPGFRMRTLNYEITEATTDSGNSMFIFWAEFFPEHTLLYVVDEGAREVEIFYLAPGRV